MYTGPNLLTQPDPIRPTNFEMATARPDSTRLKPKQLGPISIMAARCVACRCVALKVETPVTIARHATQRAAVMQMGFYSAVH